MHCNVHVQSQFKVKFRACQNDLQVSLCELFLRSSQRMIVKFERILLYLIISILLVIFLCSSYLSLDKFLEKNISVHTKSQVFT